MAIDTPARIAVLGAGPIGLEASLYARFLGYDVVIYERGEVASAVRRCGHVRMLAPFGQSRSPLGLAAIQAQDDNYAPPADEDFLTSRDWLGRYLLPLSQTDLLADHLRLRTTVLAVGKEELLKGDMPGHEDRGDWSFRVLTKNADGAEQLDLFDAVLDCTGLYEPNWLGHGGIPAIGEIALREKIEYRTPNVAGEHRDRYAAKHTLLIGAGMSAATSAIALSALAQSEPNTRVTWITRREGAAGSGGPILLQEYDSLLARIALAKEANKIAANGGPVTYWPRTVVEKLSPSANAFEVELSGQHTGQIQVDEIIANIGFRPSPLMTQELQLQHSFATEASQSLRHPEPNYYILGSKSAGRRCDFVFSDGLNQIRELFTILGDRPTLDLYAGAMKLVR
jgi:thioredoxin reductase